MSLEISGVQLGVTSGGPTSISLNDLSDVDIFPPLEDTQYLRYNLAAGVWQNVFLDDDIFRFLSTSMDGSNGISIDYTVGTDEIIISMTLAAQGDATGTATNGILPLTLATVNSSPQTNTFRKVTVNNKGLVTATSPVTAADITPLLTASYVLKAGDTMSGPLILNADPTLPLGAATKSYVDSHSGGGGSGTVTSVGVSGANGISVSGSPITTVGTIALGLGAITPTSISTSGTITATGGFIGTVTGASSLNVLKAGDTMTGTLIMGTSDIVSGSNNAIRRVRDPIDPQDAATKSYVDSHSGGGGSGTVTSVGISGANGISVSGSPITTSGIVALGLGAITPTSIFTSGTITATGGFVGNVTGSSSLNVLKAGDTMTGPLLLNADPAVPLGAATKQYVDAHSGGSTLPRIVNQTFASTVTLNWAVADIIRITLTGNIIIGNSGAVDGQKCVLELTQDSVGSRTVTFVTAPLPAVKFGTDITSFVPSTTPNLLDRLGFIYRQPATTYDVVAIARGY